MAAHPCAAGRSEHFRASLEMKHKVAPGIVLELFVGTRFQVLFHSPPGVLFAFPSRYWFTIGRQVVFSLG